MTHLKHMMIACAVLTAAACSRQAPSPFDPSVVISRFMDAVAAEDYEVMGQLWGSRDGPAVEWMDREELRKRLLVIHGFLLHTEYEVLPSAPQISNGGRLILQVRIATPNKCGPVVPITVVPYQNDWLLEAIDLNAVRPTMVCG